MYIQNKYENDAVEPEHIDKRTGTQFKNWRNNQQPNLKNWVATIDYDFCVVSAWQMLSNHSQSFP